MIIKYDVGEQIFFMNEDSQLVTGWIFERFYDENGNIGYLVSGAAVNDFVNNNSSHFTYKIDSNGIKRVPSSSKNLLPVIYKE